MATALEQEREHIHKILDAIGKSENLAEFLAKQREGTEEIRSLLETLASQALALKRQVKSLARFDKAAERIGRKNLQVAFHPDVKKTFETDLADARRNEHHALAEIHAISTVIHTLSRREWDTNVIRPALNKLYAELRKLRHIVEIIEKDINGEIILFDR